MVELRISPATCGPLYRKLFSRNPKLVDRNLSEETQRTIGIFTLDVVPRSLEVSGQGTEIAQPEAVGKYTRLHIRRLEKHLRAAWNGHNTMNSTLPSKLHAAKRFDLMQSCRLADYTVYIHQDAHNILCFCLTEALNRKYHGRNHELSIQYVCLRQGFLTAFHGLAKCRDGGLSGVCASIAARLLRCWEPWRRILRVSVARTTRGTGSLDASQSLNGSCREIEGISHAIFTGTFTTYAD